MVICPLQVSAEPRNSHGTLQLRADVVTPGSLCCAMVTLQYQFPIACESGYADTHAAWALFICLTWRVRSQAQSSATLTGVLLWEGVSVPSVPSSSSSAGWISGTLVLRLHAAATECGTAAGCSEMLTTQAALHSMHASRKRGEQIEQQD